MSSVRRLPPGAVFGADFRVVRPLSEGGMGAVYVVEQLSTGAERALKLMHPQLVADARLRERFALEARVGSRIESDHVVQIVGAGVDAATGVPWLAMELLRGTDLAERIRAGGAMPPGDVLEVFTQLCHALGAAHAQGIVHRDLKPENIFLAAPRRPGVPFTVKILDFGIAKIVAEAGTRQTAAMGSPMWMSPEQTTPTGGVSPATDVWALGLIAFHLLTGICFWRSASAENANATMLLREIVFDPIPLASARATELGRGHMLPAGFDGWFTRTVNREPSARLADATQAQAALAQVFAGAGVRVAYVPPTSGREPAGLSLQPQTSLRVATYAPSPVSTPVPAGAAPLPWQVPSAPSPVSNSGGVALPSVTPGPSLPWEGASTPSGPPRPVPVVAPEPNVQEGSSTCRRATLGLYLLLVYWAIYFVDLVGRFGAKLYLRSLSSVPTGTQGLWRVLNWEAEATEICEVAGIALLASAGRHARLRWMWWTALPLAIVGALIRLALLSDTLSARIQAAGGTRLVYGPPLVLRVALVALVALAAMNVLNRRGVRRPWPILGAFCAVAGLDSAIRGLFTFTHVLKSWPPAWVNDLLRLSWVGLLVVLLLVTGGALNARIRAMVAGVSAGVTAVFVAGAALACLSRGYADDVRSLCASIDSVVSTSCKDCDASVQVRNAASEAEKDLSTTQGKALLAAIRSDVDRQQKAQKMSAAAHDTGLHACAIAYAFAFPGIDPSAACGAPPATKVTASVYFTNGSISSVFVSAEPYDPKLVTCMETFVRRSPWPQEGSGSIRMKWLAGTENIESIAVY